MKNKILIFISLMFFFLNCKKEENNQKLEPKEKEGIFKDTVVQKLKNDSYLKDLLLEELIGVYEYKGPYKTAFMIDCPDFIEFRKGNEYYIYNDCGMTSQYDTISEKGKYEYDFKNRKLKFYNRTFLREEHFFDNPSDIFMLKINDIKKDTLLISFKGEELYFKK